MLLSAIQIANPYPNEKIDVQFNQISPQLSNARFGVRFRYFYYDTWDSKINFRKTSDYNLVSNNTIGVKLSAISPTNFLNPNELAPFRWNVASDREYLYLTLLGGLSAITIWPSHPFPKITKNNNFQLTLDVGVISASAFEGEVQVADFRKIVKNSNYSTFDGTDSLVDAVSGYATLAGGKKGYEYSRNLNYYRTFNSSSLAPDIICNSLRIDIPVVTSTNIAVDQPDQIFILSFFNDTFSNENFNFLTNNAVTNLSCLESEILTEMGITTPYTVQASMNDRTGGVLIEMKPPLYIKPNSDITVWYETSASVAPGGIYFQKNSTNNFTLSVNQGVYPNTPVYLFNYNFVSPTKDLLTISFSPSSTITNQTISSTRIETVMVDNYYQNTYDMPTTGNIMFKRFIETSGDNTLVAFNPGNPLVTYSSEQWFAANNNQSITFKNDGKGNKHRVRIQLQSAAGAIFEEDRQLDFLLNKDKITFNLSLTESNDLYAVAEANIFPTPSTDYRVKWSANPPENIEFRDRNDNLMQQNTFYPLHLYSKIYNLGVDKTEIILYSEEYDLSANTFWFPSSSVLGSAYLEIKGNVTDKNKVNTSQLSAFVNRNGYSYRIPSHANIIWNETANDDRGNLTLYSKDFSRTLKESTIYASNDNYSVINASFSTVPVESNPKQVLFNISCNVFREDFNFLATKMFWVRQYPDTQYLFLQGQKTGDSQIYTSSSYSNVFYSSSGTINLSAIYNDLDLTYSNLQWNYSYSNGTTGTATGSSLNILLNSASACVSLTAFDATPVDGNFKAYNFTDSMCFYLASSIQPFDYIGIPGNIYVPIYQQEIGDRNGETTSLSFNDLSYLNSLGMSAYKPCHTEYFSFSATPGFSEYKWKIGTKEHFSSSNITTIPIQYSDVSSSNTVGVTAFNALFSPNNPATIYNSSSSDNSSVFKEHINFYDFPSPIATISIDNNYIDVTKYSEWATLQCDLNTEFTILENYNFNIVLSSADFFQTKNINGKDSQFQKLLKINIENADFIIKENSISYMKVYLVGNTTTNLPGYDYCPQTLSLTSNFLDIAAYNGPNLYLYTSNNIVSAGESVTFFNGSNQNFSSIPFSGFSYFVFDNGENSLQSGVTSHITTTYALEGSKSPSLTGFLPDGRSVTKQWTDMIYVKNNYEDYDPLVNREIFDSISLPYSLEEIKIKPNSWQISDTLNTCFQKFQTSFEFLSASCSINNVNFPKANAGFLGSLFGNFKWHTSYTPESVQNTLFKNLKSAQIISNKLLVINDTSIEIYNITETPNLIYSFNRIGTGEVLENPAYLRYDSDNKRLMILDKSKMIFFVCDFDIDSPEDIKVTHYWGGTGERTDRTKLNNPTDFCIDSQHRVFIVDKDSYLIKVYNKNLNWLKNIQLSNFSSSNNPTYISETDDVYCVLTSDGTVTFFDYSEKILNQFTIPNCKNVIMNQIHYGIIYALTDYSILKYSINGTKIAEKDLYDSPIDISFDSESMYVITSTYIHRFIDFIEIDRLLQVSDNDGFEWSSIFVDDNEFVAAYIYNDSFTKIKDNFNLLNNRLEKKIILDLDAYGDVISQYTSYVSPNSLSSLPILIGTNEPVLYDTLNRSVENLYRNLVELKDNVNVQYNYPNKNDDIQWTWKYHYVDRNQRPSLDKTPVSWIELTSDRILNSTTLSSVSSWCAIRDSSIGGNHSQICWNYEYTQCNSYFPLTWEQLECGDCKYPFTWEDLENGCCITPDYIFEDCYSPCK